MAYPFGGHPTLGDYLDAMTLRGLAVTHGIRGGMRVVTIRAAGGALVVVAGLRLHERLEPTLVGSLDRQLGVVSGFSSMPDVGDATEVG